MAVKFSQFVVETDKANVNYLVGWDGTENVQITPADLLGSYPSGSGATGQVAFFDSASTLAGDNNLYWDNTNKRLGIGTTNPIEKLQINSGDVLINNSTLSTLKSGGSLYIDLNTFGSYSGRNFRILDNGTSLVNLTQAGNFGIGTTSPAAKLQVSGTLIATGISQLGSGGSNVYLTSSSAGNVGIGTSSPAKKLHVRGSAPWIRIEENSAGNKRLDLYVNPSTAIGVIAANQSAQQLSFQTSNTDRLRITNAGNVGIGTSSPQGDLHVVGKTGTAGRIYLSDKDEGTSGTDSLLAMKLDADAYYYNRDSGKLFLGTNNDSTHLTINSSGNVGVGTTNPSQKLEIRDETATHKLVSINRPASDTAALYIGNDSSSPSNGVISSNYSDLIFGRDQSGALTEHMRIERDGNVGIGTSSPGDYDVSDNPILAVGNTATANNSSQISVLSGSNGFGYLLFGDGETGNEAYRGQVRYDHPNDSLEFVTAGSERMQITNAGNVGIGDNPSFKLDVNVTSNRARFKAATGDANMELSSIAGRDWLISSLTDGSLRFYDEDATSERMRIDSSGNVGIGENTPLNTLDIYRPTGDVSLRLQAVTATDSTIIKFRNANSDANITVDQTTSNKARMVFTTDNSGGFVPVLSLEDNKDTLMYGNVGIGTTTPAVKLTVSDSVDNAAELRVLRANSSSSTYASVGTVGGTGLFKGSGDLRLQATGASNLSLNTNGSDRMRIDSSGNVGIGTNSPQKKLEVAGRVRATTDPTFEVYNSSANRGGVQWNIGVSGTNIFAGGNSTANAVMTFQTNTVERMRIDSTGNVGIGTTSPSQILTVRKDSSTTYSTGDAGTNTGDLVIQNNNQTVNNFNRISFQSNSDNNQTGDLLDAARITAIYPDHVGGNPSGELAFETKADAGSMAEAMRIDRDGNVGIGTDSPVSKLEVDGGDIEIQDIASGLILRSPDGTRYRVTVANGGTLSVSAV